MKGFIKTLVAASMTLAIGCSRDWMDWPLSPTEDGKVVIEGGGGEEPDAGQAWPCTIYGTLRWGEQGDALNCIVLVRNADGVCMGKIHAHISQWGESYDMCACGLATESPLPWTVYAAVQKPGGGWIMDSEVITSWDTWYNCGGIRKKAKRVDLYLYFPSLPDTTGCPDCGYGS